jgi:hypothetical protein
MMVVVEVHQKAVVKATRSMAVESALDAKDMWKARTDLMSVCASLRLAGEAREL